MATVTNTCVVGMSKYNKGRKWTSSSFVSKESLAGVASRESGVVAAESNAEYSFGTFYVLRLTVLIKFLKVSYNTYNIFIKCV